MYCWFILADAIIAGCFVQTYLQQEHSNGDETKIPQYKLVTNNLYCYRYIIATFHHQRSGRARETSPLLMVQQYYVNFA